MRLKNTSGVLKTVLDAGDGIGRTVPAQTSADFTEQGARELLASFPADWASDVIIPPAPEAEQNKES